MLLAQADFSFTQFADYLLQKGPGTAVMLLILWLLWQYGPALVQGHVTLLGTLNNCLQKNTEDIKDIKDALPGLDKNTKILGHFAEAGKIAFANNQDVQRHLDRALDERDR